MAVFKGEGGETERRPAKPVVVEYLLDGESIDEEWQAMLPGKIIKTDKDMDLGRLLKRWQGEDDDATASAAVTGTAAFALRLMGRTDSVEDAEARPRRCGKTASSLRSTLRTRPSKTTFRNPYRRFFRL